MARGCGSASRRVRGSLSKPIRGLQFTADHPGSCSIRQIFWWFPFYAEVLVFNRASPSLRSWLHSADRRPSGFLQVAPIETASARRGRRPRVFFAEAVPIGRPRLISRSARLQKPGSARNGAAKIRTGKGWTAGRSTSDYFGGLAERLLRGTRGEEVGEEDHRAVSRTGGLSACRFTRYAGYRDKAPASFEGMEPVTRIGRPLP